MKKYALILFILLFSLFFADTQNTAAGQQQAANRSAKNLTVDEIVEKSEDNMRGDTSKGSMEMIVKTKRWTRTVKMKMWSKGKKKSFILINYPPRDKGTTFLKLDNEMWQYVPKVEKIIKIPPSMMMQSWMGSDFTNDDLIKESSLADDYTYKLLDEEKNAYKIELIPKPEAAVTWGKIIYWVDNKTFLPVKEDFYDEDGELINVLTFSEVKSFNGRLFPSVWTIVPQTEDKEGNSTTIVVKEMLLDGPISDSIFSLSKLKEMAR